MNRRHLRTARAFLLGMLLASSAVFGAGEEKLSFKKTLGAGEVRCLRQLFRVSDWRFVPQFEDDMLTDASVASAYLDGKGHEDLLYLIEGDGWCGTAGCKLLIGEVTPNGDCRLLYDDDGTGDTRILQQRDHGYRRLYTPCEARFDGRHYRQLHPACPSVDVQR